MIYKSSMAIPLNEKKKFIITHNHTKQLASNSPSLPSLFFSLPAIESAGSFFVSIRQFLLIEFLLLSFSTLICVSAKMRWSAATFVGLVAVVQAAPRLFDQSIQVRHFRPFNTDSTGLVFRACTYKKM